LLSATALLSSTEALPPPRIDPRHQWYQPARAFKAWVASRLPKSQSAPGTR
jgi:hypothetical protein